MAEPQLVHEVFISKEGVVESLGLSMPDSSIAQKIAYDGAVKNIGSGEVRYAVIDKKNVRHDLALDDKGRIVLADDKKVMIQDAVKQTKIKEE